MAASVRETHAIYKKITPQHHSLKTSRITPKLATAIRCLIYKHGTFLCHKVIRVLPNVTVYTVMVIITLKTNLNEKVGFRFCQVNFILAMTKCDSIYEI